MDYIDGYVLAVPTANKDKYFEMARKCVPIFREYGAIGMVECWGDDVPEGKLTSFPMAVKCEPHETVVFSWIRWPSKAVRDKGMAAAMEDPRFNDMDMQSILDGKRMIFGGFQIVVDE